MYLLPLKFKLIPIGSWFRFESETLAHPHNGMECGPWRKVTGKHYVRLHRQKAERIGNTNVLVVVAYDVEAAV